MGLPSRGVDSFEGGLWALVRVKIAESVRRGLMGIETADMPKIPAGNFTIVNNETGRCLRVRLGRTKDVSDYKEGTKYLQYVTDKPTLELGTPDNSPATAWSFSTLDDGQERRPFNQFVNFAVTEYQNIGNFCVWMYTDRSDEALDRHRSKTLFESKLNDLPAELRTKLGKLIPEEWNTWRAETYSDSQDRWKWENRAAEAARAELEADLEAWATDEEPLSSEMLARLKATRERRLEYTLAVWEARNRCMEVKQEKPSDDDPELLKEIALQPRADRVSTRSGELLPAVRERRQAAMELEWKLRAPVEALEDWHFRCSLLAFQGDAGIRQTGIDYETNEGKKIIAAHRAYLAAAAEEGIKPSIVSSTSTAARTGLSGCGRSRDKGSTYRWVYDGTHIYGADSKTVPSERTYWTDDDGQLVGKDKGAPGQSWTLAPWKPTPQKPDVARAVVLTGLFGPLGVILGG